MKVKTCFIIGGPTASGKTGLAMTLARHFNTSILSADSRQCFRELNLGVAKPKKAWLEEIRHYFIDSHSIHNAVHSGTFESYALESVQSVFREKDVCIVAGGTGLYIRAFCEGMDMMPEIPEEIRLSLREQFRLEGLGWLQQQMQQEDPGYFATGDIRNPQRMLRALEVKMATGQTIDRFRIGGKASRNFRMVKIGIDLPKEELHKNIEQRIDQMMQAGLLREVQDLYPFKQLNALQTLGYRELFQFLEDEISMDEAVHLIKSNTRQYAKRQMTWFRKDAEFHWFRDSSADPVLRFCEESL